jgi:hypothetical protein
MNRRGEVAWRGSLKDAQQVADFRSKLLDSGCFTNVVVEEQTPTPDRQKLTVRMSAQWKAAGGHEAFAAATSIPPEKPKTSAKEPGSPGILPAGPPSAATTPSAPAGQKPSVSPNPPDKQPPEAETPAPAPPVAPVPGK